MGYCKNQECGLRFECERFPTLIEKEAMISKEIEVPYKEYSCEEKNNFQSFINR